MGRNIRLFFIDQPTDPLKEILMLKLEFTNKN